MQSLRKNKEWYSEDGYAALLGVLVMGAVISLATISILLLGIQSSRTSLTFQQSAQARGLADACVEEALQEIRDNTSYTGSDSLSFAIGDCDYTVTSDGGQDRVITAEGRVDSVVRKVQIEIEQINPEVEIESWQEVADF